jgi:hypothetical protein
MSRAMRLTVVSRATVGVSAAVFLCVALTAQAVPSLTASSSLAGTISASVGSPSDTGASDVTNLGSGGWAVQSSAVATQTGAQISTPGFDISTWLPVANDDAGAPGTEIEALAQNGECPGNTALQPVNQGASGASSVFFSANMQSCYGFMSKVGADTVAQFSVPWWWRTDFTSNLQTGQVATLVINGVVGSASVWVNGHQVATSSTVTGAYTRFSFGVTSLIQPEQRPHHQRRLRDHAELGADHRAEPAQPPERVQLPVERPGPDRAAGVGLADRARPGGLPGPRHLLGRVPQQPAARRVRAEGGPLRLGAAQLLVRHHALRQQRLHPDQRRRFLGLRQRAERGRYRPDPGLAEPGSCPPATCPACGRTASSTSTT